MLPKSSDNLVACFTGQSVCTPSFGTLRDSGIRWVVHTVAPDGRDPIEPLGRATPLLKSAFATAITVAGEAGARSLALPSLGCGVNNWTPTTAAHAALAALADDWQQPARRISQVDFVLRSGRALDAWQACAYRLFGPPASTDADESIDTWEWGSTEAFVSSCVRRG